MALLIKKTPKLQTGGKGPLKNIAPYPKITAEEEREMLIDAKLKEWDDIQNGPAGWWKGKSIPSTKDQALRRQLASNQINYNNKSTGEKAKDVAINLGLSFVPELATGAKNIPIIGKTISKVKGLFPKANPMIGESVYEPASIIKSDIKENIIQNQLQKPRRVFEENIVTSNIPNNRIITEDNVHKVIGAMDSGKEGAFTKGITRGDDYVYIHKRAGQHNPKIPELTTQLSKEYPEIIPTRQSVVGEFGNVQLQDKATGNYLHRIPEADLDRLTQTQIDNAKKAIRESSNKGLEFDFVNDEAGNAFYSPEKGFKFIDFDTKYPNAENAIEGFRSHLQHGITKTTDYPADVWLKNKGLVLSLVPGVLLTKPK